MKKYEKIFLIGFNKTATKTFNSIFLNFGYNSKHDTKWNLDSYDCFCDGGDSQNIEKLKKDYPNALFVLNTRNLKDWLISRTIYCYEQSKNWGWPPSILVYLSWITWRNIYFKYILELFKNDPDKLIIVSITKPNWILWFSNFFDKKLLFNIHRHQTRKEVLNKDFNDLMENELKKTFEFLNYNENQKNMEFLDDLENLKLYKNNIIE